MLALAATALGEDPQADPAEQAARREFNAAAALQNSGLYPRAAERWAAFLKKYPDDGRGDRVLYYLGICQLHARQQAEAATTFQKVLSEHPKFAQADGAQYNLGMAYFQLASESEQPDDFRRAAEALGTVVQKFAQSKYVPRALYFQGEALYAADDAEPAMQAYQKLIADHRDSPLLADTYYALGTVQQEQGLQAEAAETYQAFLGEEALAQHELGHEIRLRRAVALYELQQYEPAEQLLDKVAAVDDFPLADFAQLRQGQCRLELGMPAEAAELFAALPQRFPESDYRAAAQLARGKCYHLLENWQQAEQVLRPLAEQQEQESPEAAYWLGRTLLKSEQPQQALEALERAVKTFNSGEFAPYLQLARLDALYELPERRPETVKQYAGFAEKFADHRLASQARYMATLAALDQQDYAVAGEQADAFLSQHAEHELLPGVLYLAGESRLLASRQQAAEQGAEKASGAEAFYRRLVSEHPEHARAPRAHLRIAWCLYQADQHDQAIQYLEQSAQGLSEPAHVAEARWLAGRSHSAAGRHSEAVSALEAALKAHPEWSRADEVRLAAAQSLRQLDELEAAAGQLQRLLQDLADSAYRDQATFQLGEIAQQQQQWDQAVQHYRALLQQFPESELVGPAHYGLAATYFAQQEYPPAVESLNDLLDHFGDSELAPAGRYLRGLAHQRMEQYEQAMGDLQQFLETEPDEMEQADARYALALCQVGLEQYEQAAQGLSSLAQDHPEYPHQDKVYYELGHALLLQQKGEEAARAFRTLAEQLPDSSLVAESWFHVGRFHERAQEMAEDEPQQAAEAARAEQAFATGLEKAESPELRERLQYKQGDMQFRQKNFEQAAQTLLDQAQQYPQGELAGAARFLAAESLYRQQKFDQALPLLLQVAQDQVEPYEAQALYRAGACAGQLKRWPDSQQHYAALIERFEQFEQLSEARYGLGLALQQQQQWDQAKAVFQQVIEETQAETAAKACFMLGEIAFAQKDYEQAIEHFLEVAVGYPYAQWQALARFESGRCFLELQDPDQALQAFQFVVKEFPEHDKAQDAAGLIKELQP